MKCSICNQNKANRFCAKLRFNICSLCCGTKRQKEIICVSECEHLKKGKDYQSARQLSKELSSISLTASDDIFKNDEALPFIAPLEHFFFKKFYDDMSIDDTHIYNALVKIYSYQTGNINSLNADSRCEELIFWAFNELDKRVVPNITKELKTKSILRLLKSIKSISGGFMGNRNYLEFVYSQFNKDGRWSYMFEEEKANVGAKTSA